MIRHRSLLFCLILSLSFSNPTFAKDTATSWGLITSIATDRTEERLRITTTTDFYDVGCPNSEKQYTTDPKTANAKQLLSLLSQALFAKNKVQLILDGCYKGAPRIVDVYIISSELR